MEKKDELIRKRNILQNERNKMNNNKAGIDDLYLYVSGISVVATVSSILFLETAPILVHLFSFLYTVGVPGVYFGKRIYKENKLKIEIDDLDRKICNIERQEFHEQNASLSAQISYEQESHKNACEINKSNSIQSKEVENNEDFSDCCVMKYGTTRIPSNIPGYEETQGRMGLECDAEEKIFQEQSGPVKKLIKR